MTPITTRGAERFVAAETFWALARKHPPARPVSPPAGRRPARRRAADRAHARATRARARGRPAHGDGAGASRAAADRSRDEHGDVGAPGDAGESRAARRARRRRRRARRGRVGGGPRRRGPDGRAGGDRSARRGAARRPPTRRTGRSPASTCSSRRAAPGSLSTPCGSSATAPPAAWASRSPRRRASAGRGSRCWRRTSTSRPRRGRRRRDARPPPTCAARRSLVSDADVVLMAAAVADYRPAEALDAKRPKSAEPWTIDLVPTSDVARALGAARRDGQVLVAFGAEQRGGRAGPEARDAGGQERRPRRLQRRGARRHRLRQPRQRGRARVARGRANRRQGVEAGDRAARSSTRSSGCSTGQRERARPHPSRSKGPTRPRRSPSGSSPNLGAAVHATHETLRLPLLCLLSEGHVLVEDVPGVGKTVLAKALARSLDLTFHRVQFTPDLLPADVTGRQRLRPPVRGVPVPAGPRVRQRRCSSTRSTAPRRRRSPRCSRRCRRPRSPSTARRTCSSGRSS